MKRFFAALTTLLALTVPVAAQATYTWTGAINNQWANDGVSLNWTNPGPPPVASDWTNEQSALFTATGINRDVLLTQNVFANTVSFSANGYSVSQSSPVGVSVLALNAFSVTGGSTATINTPFSGTGSLGSGNIDMSGTGTLVLNGTGNNYSRLTITSGTVLLSKSNALASGGDVVLNGGTLKTGTTTGFTQNSNSLAVTDISTLTLGNSSHFLSFGSLNTAPGFLIGTGSLTINGWTGTAGSSGTNGKIFFLDTSNFTTQILQSINFTGFSNGADLLPSGELVPLLPGSTPLPEPMTILGIAFGGLGLARLRRRFRRTVS